MRTFYVVGFLFFLFGCFICPDVLLAKEEQPETANPHLSGPTIFLHFENDLFYGEDKDYTNAVQLRVVSPDLRALSENSFLSETIGDFLGKVPFPGAYGAVQYNISGGFGQQIYTPKETGARELQKDDRPYAGYLYGFFALHAKRFHRLDTFELALGIIGPSSLAKQAQNEVHRAISTDTANGWKHQLRDEPTLMLTWSRIWRTNADETPGGWGWDFLPQINLSAGTPFTRAGAGGEIRFGWNLPPDYGTSIIRPGAGITRPLEEGVPGAKAHAVSDLFEDNFSLYAFAGTYGYAVAWNSFLDGNAWKNSHSVDKFPFSGEFNAGIALNLHDFMIAYTHVVKTKEFHGQKKDGYQYGSINIGYRF